MKYINMSIIYYFYKVFIILEIKVVRISCSLSKVALMAGVGNWAKATHDRGS